MKSDIEIAQESNLLKIKEIAEQIGLNDSDIEAYGDYKAKFKLSTIKNLKNNKAGKLVLVTSINPTPAGEGKSTVLIGLADALRQIGKSSIVALREPSLGPVMGMKGGATGGGFAQVVPMEDINLHFTGDMHALTAANNTLAALIDNHLQQGNELNIDSRTITWRRTLDINDRALRNIVIGLGGKTSSVPREDHFDITVASELMAILCLSTDILDLKKRIGKILIGFSYDKKPVFVKDLNIQGAITTLLKDAIKPNLVQTLEHTPAIIHGGPFANIAHGCNSILATNTALKLGDYAVTEAGFGADLGAEKFLDIVTPNLDKNPDVIVIVATIRALKYNGGQKLSDLSTEDTQALKEGSINLIKHIENMQKYHIPVVVAINKFATDSDNELELLTSICREKGVPIEISDIHANGGKGGIELANAVVQAGEQTSNYTRLYDDDNSVLDKIKTIATEIYGAKDINLSPKALSDLKSIEDNNWDKLPVCIAKTQYSLSDDPKLLGRPKDFTLNINSISPKLGSGFIVVQTGKVLTMPGLPKKPAALNIDINEDGIVNGIF
ncbi:formate--tetrahydrofolate ligase [Companilactobacillus sp. RD055328]|uniref:formate--tetrahydrofolate ligase n=1 Tax=Companilactobacillus sp. RD055328 TaxID=2916634 RepID=UPI001FC82C14|nr:formate--tetrahydrofolate ligase [Companilactobacillus sp. RD055328]GKQ42694.1 formate--tetrahydrofolate ligase [Companilactobacillus sp. RD055328]